MTVGVVDGFLERLLGLVLHHDRVAKSAVEALEDVPAVVAANGFSNLALVVTGENFASSGRLDSAVFLLRKFVIFRQSTRGALMLPQRVSDLKGRDAGGYAVPFMIGDILGHDVSARVTHALVEPMDLAPSLAWK